MQCLHTRIVSGMLPICQKNLHTTLDATQHMSCFLPFSGRKFPLFFLRCSFNLSHFRNVLGRVILSRVCKMFWSCISLDAYGVFRVPRPMLFSP